MKELNEEFLGGTKALPKMIHVDSEGQENLICDLYKVEDEQDVLVYQDKSWVLGTQPFDFSQEEIDELNGN